VFKVVSPDNKIVTIMSRPGLVEAIDDGSNCCGDSSNLDKAFPLLFRNAGVKDAEAMGGTIDSTQIVCKDDSACDYKPNPGKGPGVSFSDFNGIMANGVWKICAGDSGIGDTGVLDSATLTILY
jgi:hypothetical protein